MNKQESHFSCNFIFCCSRNTVRMKGPFSVPSFFYVMYNICSVTASLARTKKGSTRHGGANVKNGAVAVPRHFLTKFCCLI